jgi:curved DNA-binding protein CbpA
MAAHGRNLTITQALDVLSLPLSASQDEIQAAWRKAARRTHPDHNPGNPQLARKRFDQVQDAYRVLTDPAVVAELQLATAAGPQPPYAVNQLDAFRLLSLGPRATYEEIDVRLMQLLSTETDSRKRDNYQEAYDLLTKPHRGAQEVFGTTARRFPDTGGSDRRRAHSNDAPSGMAAILFLAIGFVLAAVLVLLIATGGHSAVSEIATGVGALACLLGVIRWL